MLTILLLFSVVGLNFAEIFDQEGCSEVETVPNFDIERFSGKWYVQRHVFTVVDFTFNCLTLNIFPKNNDTFRIIEGILIPIINVWIIAEGNGQILNPEDPGKWSVRFTINPMHYRYDLLDTDYDTYAALRICVNLLFFHKEYGFIVTRERNSRDEIAENAKQLFKEHNVNISWFVKTSQENCPNNE